MTRLAVLSDIHGNLPALEAVMADMEPFAVDHIVVAGDVINWGPFSRQVLEILMANHWSVVRGNNEYYLLDWQTPRMPAHWSVYTLPPWLAEQLGSKWHYVIAGWPDSLQLRFPDAPPIRMVHGIPDNPWTPIYPDTPIIEVENWLAPIQETTVIMGHSHVIMDRWAGRWHLVNAGSVGLPLDRDHRASYMILDGDEHGWQATLRRVAFDYSRLYEEFERQHFVERVGPLGRLIIEEFRTSTLQVYPFLAWSRERYPNEAHSIAMIDEFLRSDATPYMHPAYL